MKKLTNFMRFFVLFALVICLFQANAISAQAAKHHVTVSETTVLACVNHSWSGRVENADNYKIFKVTSSNKSIVSVGEIRENGRSFTWGGIKKGKATLTVSYRYKGKKYVNKIAITVLGDKPFEYIKYGTKNIYEGKEYYSNFQTGLKSKQKITWKLKKGYKLLNVTGFLEGAGANARVIKNGDKITLSSNHYFWIVYTIQNEQGNKFEYRVLLMK